MEEQVFFLGEQKNPYRYMLNADYLLVPSLHEAAPMVFDEANIIGLPIISTNTTSAHEMVADNGGIVCESFGEIENILIELKKNINKKNKTESNNIQQKQFRILVE